jgi:hypothetical protein
VSELTRFFGLAFSALLPTGLSWVLDAGANETHAKWIAHGPPPTVLGSYTTMPWATLCKVVEALESIGSKAVASPGI